MANNFDAAAFAVKCAFPDNQLMMDDTDQPSLHVWIPAFRLCDVLSTSSTDIHPAFRVNGKEISGFWLGKYQSKVYNGRSYSLPAEDPAVSRTYDSFAASCVGKGQAGTKSPMQNGPPLRSGATSTAANPTAITTMARTAARPNMSASLHPAYRTAARPPHPDRHWPGYLQPQRQNVRRVRYERQRLGMGVGLASGQGRIAGHP